MGVGLKSLAFAAALALSVAGISSAEATPVDPNGTFGVAILGSLTETTAGAWKIGGQTTSVTIPTDAEYVNNSTRGGTYLGNSDNISVKVSTFSPISITSVSFSSTTFAIPTLNSTHALTTDLIVVVTNSLGDVLTYTFDTILATSSGNGSLNLYWTGTLTDTDGVYTAASAASMSAAIGAVSASDTGNISFTVATPPAAAPSVPEPGSVLLVASGLLGLGMIRLRK